MSGDRSELGSRVMQWRQCRNARRRELIFRDIVAVAMPIGRAMYASVLKSMHYCDRDQQQEISDVNLSIFDAACHFRPSGGRFDSLLYACVRSRAINWKRFVARTRYVNDVPLLPLKAAMNVCRPSEVDAGLIAGDEFNAWERAAKILTPVERHAFRKRYLFRFTCDEIVASLKRFLPRPRGWTRGHVNGAISRARKKMGVCVA